ncbi:MAG: TAXI family TRAP transporter solute-binding subunit, partial [Eubacteriales bacterium]
GAGLTEDDIKPQYQSFGDSTEALKDGKIDAAFVVAGAPTPAITELAATKGVYFINIDGDVLANILSDCPYYTEYTIPAGTYGDDQVEDITTITVKATMIVSADADEDDVYEITKSIFESAGSLAHDKASELSLENATSGMAVPFHAGAAKYYAEQGITVN